MFGFYKGDNAVSRLEARVGSGQKGVFVSNNRDDEGFGRKLYASNFLVQNGRFRAYLYVYYLDVASVEGGEGYDLSSANLLLDKVVDDFGGAYRGVYSKLAEQTFVMRGVDARNGARNVELHLRHLAYDEVVVVASRYRYNHVRPPETRFVLQVGLATVALHDHFAQLFREDAVAPSVFFQQQQFVPCGGERFAEVVSYVSAPYDDNVHFAL